MSENPADRKLFKAQITMATTITTTLLRHQGDHALLKLIQLRVTSFVWPLFVCQSQAALDALVDTYRCMKIQMVNIHRIPPFLESSAIVITQRQWLLAQTKCQCTFLATATTSFRRQSFQKKVILVYFVFIFYILKTAWGNSPLNYLTVN